MYTIATLYQLRQRLGLAAADTADDPRLIAALQAASALVERIANRRFTPRQAAIPHSVEPRNPTRLLLVDDLLQLTSLSNGDGQPIPLLDVITIPPAGDSPVAILRLVSSSVFVWDDTPIQAITVSGIWGWHNRWSTAWRNSADTVQNNPLSASATTITVSDADGLDSANESPRFQAGHLLRVESEYIRVLSVNTSSNQLTVLRGVNGTTAASHAQNTAIETFQPARDIESLTLRWAAWLYREPDSQPADDSPRAFFAELDSLHRLPVNS